MRVLADTHVAMWAVSLPQRLPGRIVELLTDVKNEIFVSAATIWEIAIKSLLKRWDAPRSLPLTRIAPLKPRNSVSWT